MSASEVWRSAIGVAVAVAARARALMMMLASIVVVCEVLM